MKKILLILFLSFGFFLFKATANTDISCAQDRPCLGSLYPSCREGRCGPGRTCRQGAIDGVWTCQCLRDSGGGGTTPTPLPTLPPDPEAEYIPCNEVDYPEFHSLRPYQASPCNPNLEDIAIYCGNDITIVDYQAVSYDYQNRPPECATAPLSLSPILDTETTCCLYNYGTNEFGTSGIDRCYFPVHREREIAIDLSQAEFPIMGNTEDVINSEQQSFDMPHEQKVNEYVSWYLNGVNERAEYPLLNPGDPEDLYKLVNLSGPLKKLLSFTSQQKIRTDEVLDAYQSRISGTFDCGWNSLANSCQRISYNCLIPSPEDEARCAQYNTPDECNSARNLQCEIGEPIRHDQYVSCVFDVRLPPFLQRIATVPIPCYPGLPLQRPIRLTNWFWEGPSILTQGLFNRNNLPPDPTDNDYEDDYLSYWTDYQEWRGRECLVIPVFGGHRFYFCFDTADRAVSHWWSSLFPFIPFSSTEDRLGQAEISTFSLQPNYSDDFYITFAALLNQSPAELYFAHMQETEELGEILQQTYSPQEAELPGDPSLIYYSTQPYCDLVEVRSNPGDNLFAGEITATLVYDAIVVANFYNGTSEDGVWCETTTAQVNPPGGYGLGGTCVPEGSRVKCETYYNEVDCPPGTLCSVGCDESVPRGFQCSASTFGVNQCYPDNWNCIDPGTGENYDCGGDYYCRYYCSRPSSPPPIQNRMIEILVTMNTITKTPLANEVWSRLVAGPMGTFKRFFPEVGDDREVPVKAIWDIPGATSVRYSGPGIVRIGSPDPNQSRPYPELYFPHIGGIHEYFLHGIQTALRPQGYGYPILSGPNLPEPRADLEEMCAIAEYYNIPCCALGAVWAIESGQSETLQDGVCCNSIGICGPMQIAGGRLPALIDNDPLISCPANNETCLCSTPGAWELAARMLLVTLCVAEGSCNSFTWDPAMLDEYEVPEGDFTALGYYEGNVFGCTPSIFSQCRWGAGVSYCDAAELYCATGQIPPSNCTQSFCSQFGTNCF